MVQISSHSSSSRKVQRDVDCVEDRNQIIYGTCCTTSRRRVLSPLCRIVIVYHNEATNLITSTRDFSKLARYFFFNSSSSCWCCCWSRLFQAHWTKSFLETIPGEQNGHSWFINLRLNLGIPRGSLEFPKDQWHSKREISWLTFPPPPPPPLSSWVTHKNWITENLPK